jgi:hypothetical protein
MNNLFLKLLQPSMPGDGMQMSKEILKGLKDTAHKHNLLMLLYSQLIKYQKEINQQEHVSHFLDELKPIYYRNVMRSIKQEAIEKDIIFLLQKKDIPAIVIRGNEIAREIYSTPYSRNSTDVDILIKLSDALSVDSILTDNKYSRNDRLPLKFWFHRLHHAVYYHPETNDIIEVHWNFGIPSFFRLSSEEIWREVIVTDKDSMKLTPEMFIIMLLLHHHMHFFRELRILVDIFWAFHKYEDVIDWHLFAQKIRKIGLLKTTLITLSQINDLWKESVHGMRCVLTLQKEFENMNCRIPKFLLSYFQMDLNRDYFPQIYKDKLLARLALDKWSTVIFSYFKTLFPAPEAIKELYKDRRNFTLPLNYLKFMNWRVKEWTGKH